MTDARVVGLFVYRLKNLWQTTDMSQLDVCQNPWGTGLGLVDRCGVGGSGGYATPKTLALYRQNISRALTCILKTDDELRSPAPDRPTTPAAAATLAPLLCTSPLWCDRVLRRRDGATAHARWPAWHPPRPVS